MRPQVSFDARKDMTDTWQTEFDARGFAILRDVIDLTTIEQAKALSDRLWDAWSADADTEEFSEVKVLQRARDGLGQILDGIQGGYRAFPELQTLRESDAIADLLAPRLGTELVSVVDTLFFKPPNQPDTGIAYHRDAQFRRPPEKFRDMDTKYVQIGFPLETHGSSNGGLVLVEGSHKDRSIDALQTKGVRGVDDVSATLEIDEGKTVCAEMEPGDIVLWHPQTIHGSNANRSSSRSRRFYVVGYMAAASCDAGFVV